MQDIFFLLTNEHGQIYSAWILRRKTSIGTNDFLTYVYIPDTNYPILYNFLFRRDGLVVLEEEKVTLYHCITYIESPL